MNLDMTTSLFPNLTTGKPLIRWALGLVMVGVIALGWRYPALGFIVPLAMTTGILGGFFRGRWVCGNLCPRGSFLDTWFNLFSAQRALPPLLKSHRFRWALLTGLMGFMIYRLAQNPAQWQHWGLVFWQMCLITTIAALLLGLRYSARSWCAVCPVGTLAGRAGADKYLLQIEETCKACGLCEKSCSMQLKITEHRSQGKLLEKDCIKCSACLQSCPGKNVLSWPVKKAA